MRTKTPPLTRHQRLMLCVILLAAAGLRLASLADGPVLGDEPTYAVRSLGLVDTLGSHLQTTPVDWFPHVPLWSRLSFHDHPPLVFWIQHAFFRDPGQSLFWCRLPSALAGIICVALLFLATRKLFGNGCGLLAAALFACNGLGIFYGRVAMLESVTLALILFGFVVFLGCWDRPRRWPFLGGAIGLGILAKYVAVALLPAYLLFMALYRRAALRDRRFYLAAAVALLLCTPVIVYNVQMWRATGHFDVQIASLLGQDVSDEWKVLAGKEQRGSLSDRILGLGRFFELHSALFFSLSLASMLVALVLVVRKRGRNGIVHDDRPQLTLVLSSLASLLLFILAAGSSERFLFYLTPFLCMSLAWLCSLQQSRVPARVSLLLCAIWVCFEGVFALNSIAPLSSNPRGVAFLTYAPRLHLEDRGIGALDRKLHDIVGDARPQYRARVAGAGLDAIIEQNSERGSGPKRKLMFIYDRRAAYRTTLWVYTKRLVYQGWPFISADALPGILADNPDPTLEFCFIHTTEGTLRNHLAATDAAAERLQDALLKENAEGEAVLLRSGAVAFWIHRFDARTARKVTFRDD